MKKAKLIFDFEVYPNWYHVSFLDEDHELYQFDAPIDPGRLRAFIKGKTLIGFNSSRYDTYILSSVLAGMKIGMVYRLSKCLIESDKQPWEVAERYDLEKLTRSGGFDFIDLMPLIAGYDGLKMLGARMHHSKLQELPFNPHEHLTLDQQKIVAEYCKNDCLITAKLYKRVKDQISLRAKLGRKYGLDLRSVSDAGIAEKVLVKEHGVTSAKLKRKISNKTTVRFEPPNFIKPTSPQVKELLGELKGTEFHITDKGYPKVPETLNNRVITLADRSYKIGLGGLHSIDCSGMFKADEEYMIVDVDVTSYYPAIILQTGWHPPQMGPKFNTVYQSILEQRLEAKKAGNKTEADSLKIIVNSTFGKTGNRYSALYDPCMTVGITLTGQLALLMLIERFDENGLGVISTNTDGVTVRIKRDKEGLLTRLCSEWENDSGFNLERADYKLFAQRDVNSYIAVTTEGQTKSKGALAVHGDLTHNPCGGIIQKALTDYLVTGAAIESTVMGCDDLRDFLYVKKVTGGGYKDGRLLGSVVRWYKSVDTDTPILGKDGKKVSLSDNAVPVMDLPEVSLDELHDLDYNHYIAEAEKILADITQPKVQGKNLKANWFVRLGYAPAPLNHAGKSLFTGDFSNCEGIGTQTGERVGLIQYDHTTYKFNGQGWPSSYKSVSKKLGVDIKFGGVIPINEEVEVSDFPIDLEGKLFSELSKPQQGKITALGNPQRPLHQ